MIVVPRARRVVLVQARRPGAKHFATLSQGRSTARGRFRAVYAPTSGWRLAVPARRRPPAEPIRAHLRHAVVTVLDRTLPAPSTQLAGSQVTPDTATLTWVEPADKDFTGVTIRRAVGPTGPGVADGGKRVTDTGRTARSSPTPV